MSRNAVHSRRAVLTLLALAPLTAACGKKGAILPPEGEEAAYQRNVYPNPDEVVPAGVSGGPLAPAPKEDDFSTDRTTTTIITSE